MVLEGGLEKNEDEEIRPFKSRKLELTTEGGCLLWGARVVIPKALQQEVLRELHEVHPGMCRMKALARGYVWWPRMDAEIEQCVRKCSTCQTNQSMPAVAPVHHWEYPSGPWERIHIDHAGPLNGNTFLVIIDSYSKWLEVERVHSTDSKSTIAVLRKLFATHGLPQVMVSDNGSGFTSTEFSEFLRENGIKHIRSAPYHPSSNGQAERCVRTFKEALKKLTGGDIQAKLCKLLLRYRITPHSRTGFAPCELLLKRRIRSTLSQLKPDVGRKMQAKQMSAAGGKPTRCFQVGDLVLARNFGAGQKWLRGRVTEVLGSADYKVGLLECEGTVHRHVDQLLRMDGEFVPTVRTDDLLRDMPDYVVEPTIGRPLEGIGDSVAVDTSVTVDQATYDCSGSNIVQSAVAEASDVAAPSVRPKKQLERRAPSERVRRRPAYLGCEA